MAGSLTWQKRAACLGHNPNVFFPSHGDYEKARTICSTCLVKNDCLEYAHSFDFDNYGMFGGLTPDERHVLRYGPTPIRLKSRSRGIQPETKG